MRVSTSIRGLVIVLAMFVAAPMVVRAGARAGAGNPAVIAPAQRVLIGGVDNFGRVNEHLYRGAQPERSAYPTLKDMGIDTVVKFNGEDADERRLVESLGMRFISLPWSGEGLPTHDQVTAFLTLVHDHPDYHVFVHCRVGADRTGVMVALYRIEFDHWTAAQAVSEMFRFHYHHMFLPHLERYVEAFPAAMAADPGLRFSELQSAEEPVAGLVH